MAKNRVFGIDKKSHHSLQLKRDLQLVKSIENKGFFLLVINRSLSYIAIGRD
jgi:hypothetical protein